MSGQVFHAVFKVFEFNYRANVVGAGIPNFNLVLVGESFESANLKGLVRVWESADQLADHTFTFRSTGSGLAAFGVASFVDNGFIVVDERFQYVNHNRLGIGEALQLQQGLLFQSAATELVGGIWITENQTFVA